MKKIDACGLSCPQPVLEARKGLEASPEGIEISVDNMVAVENVKRYAQNAGYKVNTEEKDGIFVLAIAK